MPALFKKRSAYKKERKRRSTGKGKNAASKVFRAVVFLVAVVLLVLPVLLLAHPVSYIPLIMVVVCVLVSWGYLQVVGKAVTVSVGQAEYTCTRGESAALEVSLSNSSPLPVPRVDLNFVINNLFDDADESRSLSCALAPFETVNVSFDVSFPHLGKYEAGVSSVVVHDLLGLFSRTRKDGTMNSVIVRPSPVIMGDAGVTQVTSDESNNSLKPIASDSEDYASVRDYQRGDSLKTVHWNLSSRNPDGKLYTRLYEEYVNPSLAIVIDHCAPDYDADTLMSLFDGIVEVSAALSEQAKFSSVDAEVRFFDRDGEQSRLLLNNEDDVNEMIERLHRIVVVGAGGEEECDVEGMLRAVGLQNHGCGNVAFVSARTDDGCLQTLREIAARRKNVIAFVAVPRDMEGRAREKFWAPVQALGVSGVSHYAVESTPLATEVVGL